MAEVKELNSSDFFIRLGTTKMPQYVEMYWLSIINAVKENNQVQAWLAWLDFMDYTNKNCEPYMQEIQQLLFLLEANICSGQLIVALRRLIELVPSLEKHSRLKT